MDDTKFDQFRDRLTASIEREKIRNNPPPVAHQKPPADDGMWFSRRDEAREQAAGEHWARRRKADQQLATSQAIHDAQHGSILDAWADDEPDGAA